MAGPALGIVQREAGAFSFTGIGKGMTKISEITIMKTIIENESDRCIRTSITRREAKAGPSKSEEVYQNLDEEKGGLSRPSNDDVAGPDQIASGVAGTGQKNIAWIVLIRNLVAVNIGELDGIYGTTPRWIRRLQRQIARLKRAQKSADGKTPGDPKGSVELTPPLKTKYSGNRIIPPAGRQDRLHARPNKKIECLDRRATALEERRR